MKILLNQNVKSYFTSNLNNLKRKNDYASNYPSISGNDYKNYSQAKRNISGLMINFGRVPISKETKEKIIELAKQGLSAKDIENQVECSLTKVYYVLREEGLRK